MKTLKIFLVMFIGIIAMISCEKDDAEPAPEVNLWIGLTLDPTLDYKTSLSARFVLEGERVDTQWVYKPDGTHQIDPSTGEWQFNPPIITPVTLAQEIEWIKTQTRADCLNETNVLLDSLKPDTKIVIGFPDDPKIIHKTDESGKSYISVTKDCFSTLYERLRQSSNKTIQQLITEGMNNTIIPTQNVAVSVLLEKVEELLPSKKSPAQFRMMNEPEKIKYLEEKIQDYRK